jgi:hypothetical protein
MAAILVSAAAADGARAQALVETLQAAGREAKLAQPRPAKSLTTAQADRAEAVVLLWSRAAARSNAVRRQAAAAGAKGKLVTLQLDRAPAATNLQTAATVSLRGWRGDPDHEGLQALTAWLDKRQTDGGKPAARLPAAPASKAAAPKEAKARKAKAQSAPKTGQPAKKPGVLTLFLVGAGLSAALLLGVALAL